MCPQRRRWRTTRCHRRRRCHRHRSCRLVPATEGCVRNSHGRHAGGHKISRFAGRCSRRRRHTPSRALPRPRSRRCEGACRGAPLRQGRRSTKRAASGCRRPSCPPCRLADPSGRRLSSTVGRQCASSRSTSSEGGRYDGSCRRPRLAGACHNASCCQRPNSVGGRQSPSCLRTSSTGGQHEPTRATCRRRASQAGRSRSADSR